MLFLASRSCLHSLVGGFLLPRTSNLASLASSIILFSDYLDSYLPIKIISLGLWGAHIKSLDGVPRIMQDKLPIPRPLCEFFRAAEAIHHRLGGLNRRNFLSPSFGGWKSKMKGPASLLSPEVSLSLACRCHLLHVHMVLPL